MNAMVQSLKDLNQIKLAAMIGTAVVMIGFFAYISLRVTAPTMAPLYTQMPLDDGAKVTAALDAQAIPYQVRANGTQILVPADQVDKIRIDMAGRGLPSQGSLVGYEIFDKSDTLGTSNFVLSLNQIRALEGELSRTIKSLDTVEDARVHLVMPKREMFSREKVEPTASVAVKLKKAGGLDKGEVAAIRSLVATAVPGLKAQHVTIVDSRGVLLAKGNEDDNDPNTVSANAEEFRADYEKKTSTRIEQLLEQSVGLGKVKAEVHADIDFDRTVTNREKYDPEGQVARSTQSVTDSEKANEGGGSGAGSVSVSNQIPQGQANNSAGGSNSASDKKRTEETTNYEISKEVVNSVKEAGNVRKLSIAVLVDGIYTKDKDGKETYAPRSAEELAQISQLVKSAVGFDTARGDDVQVINMQFASAPADMFKAGPLDFLMQDMNSIIQTMVLGGVAILAILLVIRPLVARAIESAEMAAKEDEMEQAALAAPNIAARLTDQTRAKLAAPIDDEEEGEDMISVDRIAGKMKSSTVSKLNSMVEKNPDETAQILRAWIAAGGGN